MSASRERLQQLLDAEIGRWQSKSYDELIALDDPVVYELEGGFQVEVTVFERRPDYVHVGLAVHDGTFVRSCVPLTGSVIVRRPSADL
jgi:hypothetical protein